MTSSPISIPRRLAGFTLVEILIATSIGTMILAGVLSVYLCMVRGGVRTNYYASMEAETRLAFEQMGLDARMSNGIASTFTSGAITSITLTIPDSTLATQRQVVYTFDATDPQNKKLIVINKAPDGTIVGRRTLIGYVETLTFLRYDSASALIPAATVSDAGVKHIQVSVKVSRKTASVAVATQVIRSSAFTLRNI